MGAEHNKGIAIFISLALLFLLSVAAIVVLLSAYNYTNVAENQIKRLKAIVLAESGIQYAYWKLRTDPGFRNETIRPDEDPSSPSVEITVSDPDPVSGRYQIDSRVIY